MCKYHLSKPEACSLTSKGKVNFNLNVLDASSEPGALQVVSDEETDPKMALIFVVFIVVGPYV